MIPVSSILLISKDQWRQRGAMETYRVRVARKEKYIPGSRYVRHTYGTILETATRIVRQICKYVK